MSKNNLVNPETGRISITDGFGKKLARILGDKIIAMQKASFSCGGDFRIALDSIIKYGFGGNGKLPIKPPGSNLTRIFRMGTGGEEKEFRLWMLNFRRILFTFSSVLFFLSITPIFSSAWDSWEEAREEYDAEVKKIYDQPVNHAENILMDTYMLKESAGLTDFGSGVEEKDIKALKPLKLKPEKPE